MTMFFSACGKDEIKIEDYKWALDRAISLEDGLVVVSDEEDSAKPDVRVAEFLLTANDGEIIIEDKTGDKTFDGAYEEMYITDSNDDYKIIIKGKEGYMKVSEITSQDRKMPELVMTIDGYDLYFHAEEDK